MSIVKVERHIPIEPKGWIDITSRSLLPDDQFHILLTEVRGYR